MKKVLHVVSSMNAGGVENIIYSYCQNMDRNRFKFDIAVYTSENGVFREEFEKIGFRIFKIPSKRHVIKSIMYLSKLIKNESYDIIHVHLDDQSFLALLSAVLVGTKTRILHSHLGDYSDGKPIFLHKFMRVMSISFANRYFACSEKAAKEFYPKHLQDKVFIMKNGVNVNKFLYNENTRKILRKELGLSEKDIVIGNIARITEQKNPYLVLRTFELLKKKYRNLKLLYVGEGYEFEKLQHEVNKSEFSDSVIFTGAKTDANRYYNVLDVFFLPSKFEGLGMSFIESQMNGLITLATTMVPRETKISDSIVYINSVDDENKWFRYIDKYVLSKCLNRNSDIDYDSYDISLLISKLEIEYDR